MGLRFSDHGPGRERAREKVGESAKDMERERDREIVCEREIERERARDIQRKRDSERVCER